MFCGGRGLLRTPSLLPQHNEADTTSMYVDTSGFSPSISLYSVLLLVGCGCYRAARAVIFSCYFYVVVVLFGVTLKHTTLKHI